MPVLTKEPTMPNKKTAAEFHEAMKEIYHRAKKECGYSANYFWLMLQKQSGLEVAKAFLANPNVTDGFTELMVRGRPDLTVEAYVLKPEFRDLFTAEEIRVAEERLGRPPGGASGNPR